MISTSCTSQFPSCLWTRKMYLIKKFCYKRSLFVVSLKLENKRIENNMYCGIGTVRMTGIKVLYRLKFTSDDVWNRRKNPTFYVGRITIPCIFSQGNDRSLGVPFWSLCVDLSYSTISSFYMYYLMGLRVSSLLVGSKKH